MEAATHVEHLEAQGLVLLDAAARAGLGAPVPSCPEWAVRDLVAHVSGVHRWARAIVATARPEPTSGEDDATLLASVADDEKLAWFDAGLRELVATLRAAPEDLVCWTFLPSPTSLAFWARRQCHETAVHAVDAVLAAGGAPQVPADLAVDGLDELLYGFFSRPRFGLCGEPAFSLSLQAADAPRSWTIEVGPDGALVTEAADGACRLTGPVGDLYTVAWNRTSPDSLEVEGDEDVLVEWRRRATVTWS